MPTNTDPTVDTTVNTTVVDPTVDTTVTLDLPFTRSLFPAFTRPLPARTAFFDNAGGSYIAAPVLAKLLHYYHHNQVQPNDTTPIGQAATAQMHHGHQTIADLLGVPIDTVTLGPSTTQNINTLAHACDPLLTPGDQLIVTAQDHEANIGAWHRLCHRTGATLITWQIDPTTADLSLDALDRLLTPRVKLIALTHSSNIIGTINPIADIITRARAIGARTIIDGVSCAPHQWPDLATLTPDAYCFSTYKTFATHLGVMVITPDFAETLNPQCHYFNTHHPTKRLDAAGPNHASIAALTGLADYFTTSYQHHFGTSTTPPLAHQAQAVSRLMHCHEQQLAAPLLTALRHLPLRIIGRDTLHNREANIAITSPHHTSRHLTTVLATNNISAAHGHFYAKRLLTTLGIKDPEDGVLRLSLAHYNTPEEITRVIDCLTAQF